jgi:alkylhydroperoxidase family enzyme
MAWVKPAPEASAQAHILGSHSLNPAALRAHLGLYRTIMYGDSPLARAEREAMAVAVAAVNDCHY